MRKFIVAALVIAETQPPPWECAAGSGGLCDDRGCATDGRFPFWGGSGHV